MKLRNTIVIVLALLLLITLSMLPAVAQDEEPVAVTFGLPFVPNIQFAPLYIAIAQGYTADAGLAIDLEYGDENLMLDLVAVGEMEFAMIGGEQIILARQGERPVVFVYEWFQQFAVGIAVPDTTEGVENPADIAGLRVGIPGRFGASYSGLTAFLSANGLTEDDIRLEAIGFNAPDVVCLGAVEAAVIYRNNEPLQIQQRADAGECGDITSLTVFPVAADVDLVSNGIVVSESMIAASPDMVQAMVTAFDLALRDTINNPAEAYLLSDEFVDGLPLDDDLRAALEAEAEAQREFLATEPDREAIAESHNALIDRLAADFAPEQLIQLRVLLASIPLWDAEILGATDAESWETTQEVLLSMGTLETEIDLAAAYSNAFVTSLAESE